MFCNVVRRACAHNRQHHQSTLRLVAATLVVALLAASSHAALIGTYSLRFDGFVKQGANTGEEGHFAANLDYLDNFPQKQLPANVDPPPPLLEARDLLVTDTEAANHIIISITNNTNDAKMGALFNNPLDPAVPLEWEAIFSWTNVGPLEKIKITGVGVEHGNTSPYPAPTSQTITGKGTVADPLKVSLLISPNQLNPTPNNQIIGPFKIHLDYMTMPIPEPASIALGMLGMLGMAGLVARHRR